MLSTFLAARALTVGVYAAQRMIAQSQGCASLSVAEVEGIVKDSLVRSHFHDSGLSPGSIRLVLMQVGDKLGLQGLKIGEGYATYLAQAFADSVVVAADVQSSGSGAALPALTARSQALRRRGPCTAAWYAKILTVIPK